MLDILEHLLYEFAYFLGDIITRLSLPDDMGWVKCVNKHGARGLIPASYVEDCK